MGSPNWRQYGQLGRRASKIMVLAPLWPLLLGVLVGCCFAGILGFRARGSGVVPVAAPDLKPSTSSSPH